MEKFSSFPNWNRFSVLFETVNKAVYDLSTGFCSPNQAIITINSAKDIFEFHEALKGVVFCEMHVLRIQSLLAKAVGDLETIKTKKGEIKRLIEFAIDEKVYFKRLSLTHALVIYDLAKASPFEQQEWIQALYECENVLESLICCYPDYKKGCLLLQKIRKDISNINPI